MNSLNIADTGEVTLSCLPPLDVIVIVRLPKKEKRDDPMTGREIFCKLKGLDAIALRRQFVKMSHKEKQHICMQCKIALLDLELYSETQLKAAILANDEII